ncbi:hypothetical protein D3H65_30540 [Paraflavitalea soli]|uniref:Uncharacterized protein n=1 Tax=Paraflavitalea soli TaxID=2315862 RepID=A0A3B7MVU3_9BACT|nr:hypothetical protein [Paraflavitalea soli]AXY78067.1 hypothetical protein D3H65_30540 [Paraflavitalea soli]
MYKKLSMPVLFLFVFTEGIAQLNTLGSNPFMSDANGRPAYLKTEYNVEGSPWYHDAYSVAEITSTAGKVYSNVQVKINLAENEVLYLADDGKEMVATIPIKKIRFIQFVSKEGVADKVLESFGQPMNTPKNIIYEVLDSGKCTLLRQIRITSQDNRRFNEASITRTFQRSEFCHVLLPDGKIQKLSAGKDDMINLLQDKKAEVSAFIDEKRLKCRNVEDYRKVIAYYNSL